MKDKLRKEGVIEIIKVSSLLAFRNKKVLLVRSSVKWTLPGGKMKEETREECLVREVEEELKNSKVVLGEETQKELKKYLTIIRNIKKFKRFPNEISPHFKHHLDLLVFKGKIEGPIIPNNEIKEAKWFTLQEINEKIGEISSSTILAIKESEHF